MACSNSPVFQEPSDRNASIRGNAELGPKGPAGDQGLRLGGSPSPWMDTWFGFQHVRFRPLRIGWGVVPPSKWPKVLHGEKNGRDPNYLLTGMILSSKVAQGQFPTVFPWIRLTKLGRNNPNKNGKKYHEVSRESWGLAVTLSIRNPENS